MASIEPVDDKHWRVFLAERSECDFTVEVRLTPQQASEIHRVANQRLYGLGAHEADFPTAVMMLLSAPKP